MEGKLTRRALIEAGAKAEAKKLLAELLASRRTMPEAKLQELEARVRDVCRALAKVGKSEWRG